MVKLFGGLSGVVRGGDSIRSDAESDVRIYAFGLVLCQLHARL